MGRIAGTLTVGAIAIMLLAAVIIGRQAVSEQLYTTGDVRAGLQRHPALWAGRTVLVRGRVGRQVSYPQCASPTMPLSTCPQIVYLSFLARFDPATFHFATVVRGNRSFRTLTYPDTSLYVQLAPGMTALPQTPTPLPPLLYALPLIGPTLAARFPRNGDTVLRIHLASARTCAAPVAHTGPCLDGIVQN